MMSKTLFLKSISSISSLQNIKGIFQLCIFLLTAGIKIPGKWSIGKCHRPLSSLLPVDVNLWTEFPFEPSKEQSVSDRAPVDFIRGFRNPEIFLVESGILGFEILNTAQRIQNPAMIRIQNPISFVKDPESTAMNPESKTVLDYLI